MPAAEVGPRGPGRPPSQEARQAVLEAVLALLAEHGQARVSMDALASRAGVSKATIYRHWPSKEDVCREALARLGPCCSPTVRRRSITESLSARAAALARSLQAVRGGIAVAEIAAGAGSDERLRRAWEAAVVDPHRWALQDVLEQAVADGSARNDLDVDAATIALVAPLVERATRGQLRGLQAFARRLAATIWQGAAQPAEGGHAERSSERSQRRDRRP